MSHHPSIHITHNTRLQARIQSADEAYQRGNAFYKEGRRDRAATLYQKAVGLFPK